MTAFKKNIESRILLFRGCRVMIDADLAEVYGVSTKALNQAVKRNGARFPADFMFRLNRKEKNEVVTICDHLELKFSPSLPYAFTEYGAFMAANVLNSRRAVSMSVYVIRAFVRMREEATSSHFLEKRFSIIEKTLFVHDRALRNLFIKIRPLFISKRRRGRRQIGFHSHGN